MQNTRAAISSKLRVAVLAAISTSIMAASIPSASAAEAVEEILIFGTQSRFNNDTGSRLNLTVLETPATVDIINGAAIRARIDNSVLQAVTRSAGFTFEANPGNGNSSIAARGFRGQGSVTKLYDGTNYYTAAGTNTFPFDTWGIERIEILKGPSSVIYGEGGIGGAINVIPKKANYDRSGAIRVIAGEDNTLFVGLDYNAPINDSMAARIVYSNHSSDNWVENGDSEAEMLALSFLWNVSEDLELTARYDRGDQSPMKYFGVPIANGDFIDSLLKSNFNVADAVLRFKDDAIRVKADWTISDTANLQTEVFRLSTDRYWKNTEYYSYDEATQLVDRWDPIELGHDMNHTGLRSNLNFALADERLKVSAGFEVNDVDFERPSNFGPANSNRVDWGNDFDTVDPSNFQPGTLADLTDATVMLDNMADVKQWAAFSEAQFMLTDRLSLVGALRFDDYSTDYVRLGRDPIDQSTDALTGRVGTVFNLSENTVIYGQYGTGATHPSNSIVTASASNRESDLIKSEQIEIGIKHQVENTGLQWNIALFDIVKNDLIEDDPDSANPDDFIVIPEQTSRGIELGLNYSFDNGLQLYGNLSALNAETDTGETPTLVPEKTANLGLAWDISEQFLFIADARYVGERFHSARPIPSFTVVDTSFRWNLENDIGITLKADNVFDELYASSSYYSSTWLVGKPRTFSLAVDYSF